MATEKKSARYLDTPLQHASDKLLLSMKRGRDSKFLKDLLTKLRARVLESTCSRPPSGKSRNIAPARAIRPLPHPAVHAARSRTPHETPQGHTRQNAQRWRPSTTSTRGRRSTSVSLVQVAYVTTRLHGTQRQLLEASHVIT